MSTSNSSISFPVPHQSVFVMRQMYFLGLTNFLAHVFALIFFFAAWEYAKRSRLLFHYVAFKHSPLSIVKNGSKKKISRKTCCHMSILAFLILISFVASQVDILINTFTVYGGYIFSSHLVGLNSYATIVVNGTGITKNLTLKQISITVNAIGKGGVGRKAVNPAPYDGVSQIYCNSGCSLDDCVNSMYYSSILDDEALAAFTGLVPNPSVSLALPKVDGRGGFLNYSSNRMDFYDNRDLMTYDLVTPASNGFGNYSTVGMMRLRQWNVSDYIYFALPIMTEVINHPVHLLYYEYNANSRNGAGYVKYASLLNDPITFPNQYAPTSPTIAPLRSCLISADSRRNPVYICMIGTAGTILGQFEKIQLIVLADSEISARQGTTANELGFANDAMLNVTATQTANLSIIYTPNPGNRPDVNRLPKLAFNLTYAVRIMNNQVTELGAGLGPNSTTNFVATGLVQALTLPPHPGACVGGDNLYIFKGGENYMGSVNGTLFALIELYHLIFFALCLVAAGLVIYYNDFNRTMLQIMAQTSDLPDAFSKRHEYDQNGLPRLVVVEKKHGAFTDPDDTMANLYVASKDDDEVVVVLVGDDKVDNREKIDDTLHLYDQLKKAEEDQESCASFMDNSCEEQRASRVTFTLGPGEETEDENYSNFQKTKRFWEMKADT